MAATVLKLKTASNHQARKAAEEPAEEKLKNLPKPELDRKKQLMDQYGIKKPLEIDDAKSVLTIDPGVGATQVDTYATVPKNGKHDGVFMKLKQTDWATARVEGPDVDAQMTVPPRSMAGAFGFWAAQNGPMTLAGKTYKHSELDRSTGEVVLSDFGRDKAGNLVLEQRRLRPSAGSEVSGEMLTAMPPKVGLVGFPEEFKPEPALLAARSKGKQLKGGATLHVSGKSFENLKADVTSQVRPAAGGWTDPSGVAVEIDTWLRVMNTDRAPIHHDSVVLRSAQEKSNRYYDNDGDGPTTIHHTELPNAKLNVGPGESQEILVEKQEGRAHVEYRLSDDISTRPAGAGVMQSDQSADRFMVLDHSKGKRHAGEVQFFDGVVELGSAKVKSASPGAASTTSDQHSSGVTSESKTTWSAPRAEGANKRAQTVTKEYTFSNISPVAGQLKLTTELENFSERKSIKINGQELKDKLDTPEFTAKLESERWGGAKIQLTLKMPGGTEQAPAKMQLKVEVEGKFNADDQ